MTSGRIRVALGLGRARRRAEARSEAAVRAAPRRARSLRSVIRPRRLQATSSVRPKRCPSEEPRLLPGHPDEQPQGEAGDGQQREPDQRSRAANARRLHAAASPSHPLRRREPEQRQRVRQHRAHRQGEPETRARQRGIVGQHPVSRRRPGRRDSRDLRARARSRRRDAARGSPPLAPRRPGTRRSSSAARSPRAAPAPRRRRSPPSAAPRPARAPSARCRGCARGRTGRSRPDSSSSPSPSPESRSKSRWPSALRWIMKKRKTSTPDLLQELVDGHVGGPARRLLHLLAAAGERDELVHHQLDPLRRTAERADRRAHEGELLDVVGALDVDHRDRSRAGTSRGGRRCRAAGRSARRVLLTSTRSRSRPSSVARSQTAPSAS